MIDRRGERGVEVDLPTISPANHAARPKGARRRHDPTARKEEEWCPGPSQISHLPLEAGDRRGSRRVADRAVQIHGGSGYIADYAVERFYRDVRIFRLYEGTSQIQQLLIAKEMIRDYEG